MSLRWKIAFSLAAIALVATTSVGVVSYRSTAERLLAEVDRSIGQVGAQVVLGGRVAGVPARDATLPISTNIGRTDRS
jgi:hypothetical protein